MADQTRKSRPARDRRVPMDVELRPTSKKRGVDDELGAEHMRRLRALHNAVADAYTARDMLIYELGTSPGGLTRQDMATACGMNKSRIDQIIEQIQQKVEASRSATPR